MSNAHNKMFMRRKCDESKTFIVVNVNNKPNVLDRFGRKRKPNGQK